MKQIEVTIMGQSYILACADGGESALLEAVNQPDLPPVHRRHVAYDDFYALCPGVLQIVYRLACGAACLDRALHSRYLSALHEVLHDKLERPAGGEQLVLADLL